jgi:hypothetical protein
MPFIPNILQYKTAIIPADAVVQVVPAVEESKINVPIARGAPAWLTGKNILIGTGIGLFSYIAYALLLPPKKKTTASAVVSGLGRIFSKRRRRRR